MSNLAELVREALAPDAQGAIAMSRADDIRKLALASGVDVVGIAPVERWDEFVPAGSRPYDILPGAKSVVVVGVRGPSAGAWQSPDHRLIEMNGYDFANDRVIHLVADHIEREYGYQAIQAPGLPIGGHQPAFSMMLAAIVFTSSNLPCSISSFISWSSSLFTSEKLLTKFSGFWIS